MTNFKKQVACSIGCRQVERIKVAVLDTGIDTTHPSVQKERHRIVQHKSFVGGDATVDVSGHGTHIAGIMLDLSNNIDLYVWKFTESRTYGEREKFAVRERIVEVNTLHFDIQQSAY